MCIKPGLVPLRKRFQSYQRKNLGEYSPIDLKTINSQKRKEKSRDAARCRRGKESEIFGELASACPLANDILSNLDKASVMRLSIAFLKTRDFINRGLPIMTNDGLKNDTSLVFEEESLLLRALDGFILVMTALGDVVYASKNISTFLGLSQIDTMGQSIMELAHPCDHEEMKCFVSPKRDVFRNSFIRLKCTITPKGRSVNLKSASYKVMQICGRVLYPILCKEDLSEEASNSGQESDSWVVALAMPVPHPSNIEIPLDKQIFVSRHSLDMKFTYIDENIKNFCGYESSQLMGLSMYEMSHALDAELVRASFRTLFSKGQVETSCYRFLALGGGYVWIVTQATLISNPKDSKPHCVVCLNYVVSEILDTGNIVSEVQLLPEICSQLVLSPVYEVDCKEDTEESICPSPDSDISTESADTGCYSVPVAATSSLLMERTEDMEEGFLTFSSSDPYAAGVFKEEPEDLTHLAPSVGDDFLPLDIPLLYPSDIDDFLKGDPLPLGQGPLSGCTEISLPFLDDAPRPTTDAAPSSITKSVFSRQKNPCEDPSSNLVPDLVTEIYKDSSQSPVTRFDTPDPPSPLTPLLSQASTSCVTKGKYRQQETFIRTSSFSKPSHSTSETFSSSGSTMDLFSSLDLKLEDDASFDGEDFDPRAPYIAPMDDMLCSNQEDLLGSSQELLPTFDLLPMLDKQDDGVNKYEGINSSILLRSSSPLQHCKGCVDPNKVLPGHYQVNGESAKHCEELRSLLQKATNLQPRYQGKRSHSFISSPTNKKSRTTASLSPGPVFAPVMQQLLSDRSLPSALENLGTLPVNSDGKVELTKQQLSTILGSAGLRFVSIDSEESRVSAEPRKKTEYLLINPGMPKLRNLSQFDCEVNAPAPTPALLQGSELLSALDQTI